MTSPLTSTGNSSALRIAVIGSGPSGFYATEALFDSGLDIQVDMIECLPVPFGLVRFGVAPDHPKLKSSALVFDRIAQHANFRFFGNVTVGKDVSVEELRDRYHAVIFCSGAEADRNLDVPGEQLPGSHAATEFVGWYNGRPEYRDCTFDLSHETAVVLGQGNVAADCVRILMTPVDTLARTDMASHAIEALRQSKIRTVHVVGRRGPAQVKFTAQELRELGEIPGVAVRINADDLALNPESLAEIQEKKNFGSAKNIELMKGWAARPAQPHEREIIFHFLESPVAISGEDKAQSIRLEKNRLVGPAFSQTAEPTGTSYDLPCGLVLRSIGYRGLPIDGLPFDQRRGALPHEAGRVLGSPGVYCSGWIKRGPSGIIGTNRACAVETVASLLKDLTASGPGAIRADAEPLSNLLEQRGVFVVGYKDWKKIDEEEIRLGQLKDKPREKFTRVADMLSHLA